MEKIWEYSNRAFSIVSQVYSIKDEKEKEKKVNELVEILFREYSKDHAYMVERILEIESDVELKEVPEKLMESLKEAIFCYLNGQFISTIAAVGITSELFCAYLYERYLDELKISRLEKRYQLKKFGKNHAKGIEELQKIGIGDIVISMLHEIRKKRNETIHPGKKLDYHSEALDCLQMIIDLLNLYSDSLGEASILAEEENKKESEKKQEDLQENIIYK